MSIQGAINIFHFTWRRLVSCTWYRLIFGSVGRKSTIFRPSLLVGPERIFIGSRCLIRYGCRLETVPTEGRRAHLKIGNNVNIEQNVHIICHDSVVIGDNVSITGHCAIVDVSHPPTAYVQGLKIGTAIADGGGYVEIGEGSFLGFGTIVLPNVKIGKNCMIGAGSVVNCDIPDFSIAAGAPARVLRRNTVTGSDQS